MYQTTAKKYVKVNEKRSIKYTDKVIVNIQTEDKSVPDYLKYQKNISLVTQDTTLFDDTIKNNISYANQKVSEKNIIEVAKLSFADEFINNYQTNIGEKGEKLSGGQKQRISIARAVLKNPEFLILDEATSSLDTESEKLVQDALSNLMKNRTTLVIAHRLSTIKDADEIIVLSEGKIVERGSHESLVNENGVYKTLINLQNIS